MTILHIAEHAMAVTGAISLLALLRFRLARARRERERKSGVTGKRWIPCPVEWCVGHHDVTRFAPSFHRGHLQPCWNGTEDPKRIERL